MAQLRTPNGHIVTLPAQRVSVGESLANEVPVAKGLGVASEHFRLQPWEGGHFLEDAGSGLGTLVNGKPVGWVPLQHGDVITAGELTMIYSKDGSAVEAPAAGDREPAAAVEATVVTEPVEPAAAPVRTEDERPRAEKPAAKSSDKPAGEGRAVKLPPVESEGVDDGPPSWVPAEALAPPTRPDQWHAASGLVPGPGTTERRSRGWWRRVALVVLLLAAAGAAAALAKGREKPSPAAGAPAGEATPSVAAH